jgi:hypothetical protein
MRVLSDNLSSIIGMNKSSAVNAITKLSPLWTIKFVDAAEADLDEVFTNTIIVAMSDDVVTRVYTSDPSQTITL